MKKIVPFLILCLAACLTFFHFTETTPEVPSDHKISSENVYVSKKEALESFKPNLNESLKSALEWAKANPEAFANGPATCFAPDTDRAFVEAFYANRTAIQNSLGIETNRFNLGNRWNSTATNGGGLGQGDITTLTWSYVPDGTTIGNGGCQLPDAGTFTSDFISFFNGIYGPPAVPGDYTTAPWHTIFVNMFNSWSTTSGLIFVYEPNDDGATNVSSTGILGVRGDMRISGHLIDGNSGVLACNYFPNGGDMIIDTGDNYFANNPTIGTTNVLTHEIGHGIGIQHVCPVNTTKLMEPFVTTAFTGPQEDDILAANRGYGDPDGTNDTAVGATFLGANPVPTSYSRSQRSIDDNGDTDYYSFTVNQATTLSGTLTPTGTTYLDGVQNPNGSCSAGSNFNALTVADLMFEIVDTNGVTILATGNGNGPGVAETVNNIPLPVAGTYYVKVNQEGTAVNNVQMYDLDFSLSGIPNDAPVATAPNAPTVNEDDINVALDNNIDVSDPDGDNQTVTFTITGGTVTLGAGGITFGGGGNGTANFTAAGTLANINTALDAATFTPTPNLNGVNAGIISFSSNDGIANSNDASVTFDIGAVNDDPTYNSLPTDVIVIENTPSNVDLSAGVFDDIDSATSPVTLTITAGVGTLTGVPGGGVSVSGAANTVILDGTAANIDTYLNIPANLQYTGPPGLTGDDATTLTITANDGGNTGAGGGTTVSLGVVNVDIVTCNLTIMCPANVTIECDEDSSPTNTGTATATDACPGTPVITFSDMVAPGVGNNSVITRTWMATNAYGNSSSCDQIITVEDTTPPVLTCPGDSTIECDEDTTPANTGTATATDNCDGSPAITFSDVITMGMGSNFTITRTWTATDANANASNCVQVITVEDTTPPMANCAAPLTVQLDASGNISIDPSQINNGSIDNCGDSTLTVSPESFTCADVGPNMVTLTVTDENGNSSSCTTTVTVEDSLPPAMVCQDITVQLDATGNVSITPASIDGGSTDNCGIASITASPTDFTCGDVGPNNVTLTITDVNGNSNTCTAIVTVEDTIDPIAVCQDITIQLDANGNASIVATDVDGGSTDNCETLALSLDMDTFNCANVGPNDVVLTATDISGNSSSCVAVVTVEDNSTPSFTCQNITVPLDETGTVTILPEDVITNLEDVCNTLTIELDVDTFTCANIGTPTVVTVTANNANGVMITCTATVNVVDTLGPAFDNSTLPSDQERETDTNGEYILEDFTQGVLVTDNCSSVGAGIVLEQDPLIGSVLTAGVYDIILSVEDEYGNSDAYIFELVVTQTLGIEENNFDTSSLTVYPNPASNYVVLSNPKSIPLKGIGIYDITGRLIKNVAYTTGASEIQMDISELANATYFILITTEIGQVTKQLIKK